MAPKPHRPRALAWQVFRGSDALRRRLLTPHQLRSKVWVRLLHDVYADARLDQDHGLTCQAAALRLPPAAVIAGPSAAWLHGVEHAAGFGTEIHVIVPTKIKVGPLRGLCIHSTDLDPMDTVTDNGLQRTTPARTAGDCAAWLDLPPAISIIDSLLGQHIVGADELRSIVRRNADRPRPGSRRTRRAFELADGRARSSQESQLRVRLVLAGLPKPVPRCPIRLSSGTVLHPDLGWPEFKVAVEYDGPWHGSQDQLYRDRHRLNQFMNEGWIVLYVTSLRMDHDFTGIVREVRSALAARGWRE